MYACVAQHGGGYNNYIILLSSVQVQVQVQVPETREYMEDVPPRSSTARQSAGTISVVPVSPEPAGLVSTREYPGHQGGLLGGEGAGGAGGPQGVTVSQREVGGSQETQGVEGSSLG